MIYFSSLLQTTPAYKPVVDSLFAALDTCGLRYALLPNTKDIWLRDFMPVKRKDGKYISFRYDPSYLKEYPHRKTDFKRDISRQFWIFYPEHDGVIYSDINLDGGNLVFSPSKNKAIVSDRIFAENSGYTRNALIHELEQLLEAQVILIPSLPSDMTGHADGMVRFVDEDTVIGNATPYQNGLEQRIKAALKQEGFRVIDFPYYASPKGSAAGCYLNFLETDSHILFPVFGSDMDHRAVEAAKQLFPKTIVPVQINEIAAEGGCLNCISWEISVKAPEDDTPVVSCPVCGGETQALCGIVPTVDGSTTASRRTPIFPARTT